MPAGQLYINGSDAYTTWGISLDSTGLSAILTPPPLKDMIQNASALEHGTRVVRTGRKYDSRTITVNFNISAPTEASFMTRYNNFCSQVLATGQLNITTSFTGIKVFRFDYLSCQSFSEYSRGVGKFVLRLFESNPDDRTPADS